MRSAENTLVPVSRPSSFRMQLSTFSSRILSVISPKLSDNLSKGPGFLTVRFTTGRNASGRAPSSMAADARRESYAAPIDILQLSPREEVSRGEGHEWRGPRLLQEEAIPHSESRVDECRENIEQSASTRQVGEASLEKVHASRSPVGGKRGRADEYEDSGKGETAKGQSVGVSATKECKIRRLHDAELKSGGQSVVCDAGPLRVRCIDEFSFEAQRYALL